MLLSHGHASAPVQTPSSLVITNHMKGGMTIVSPAFRSAVSLGHLNGSGLSHTEQR